jgi:hypothetical protein
VGWARHQSQIQRARRGKHGHATKTAICRPDLHGELPSTNAYVLSVLARGFLHPWRRQTSQNQQFQSAKAGLVDFQANITNNSKIVD